MGAAMRRHVRDAIASIRDAGGTNINVGHGGRHTEIAFTVDGRREVMRLHQGSNVSARFERLLRSQLRRKTAN